MSCMCRAGRLGAIDPFETSIGLVTAMLRINRRICRWIAFLVWAVTLVKPSKAATLQTLQLAGWSGWAAAAWWEGTTDMKGS